MSQSEGNNDPLDMDIDIDASHQQALDEHNYDFFMPALEELNTVFISMKDKYKELEPNIEFSTSAACVIRRMMRDIEILTRDKLEAKKCIAMLYKKYEELNMAEKTAKSSTEDAQRKEEEFSRLLEENSMGKKTKEAFSSLLESFKTLELSNKSSLGEVMKSSKETMEKLVTVLTVDSKTSITGLFKELTDGSKTSITDVAKELTDDSKKSITDVADALQASICTLTSETKIAIGESSRQAKTLVDEGASSITTAIEGFNTSMKTAINEQVRSSSDNFIDTIKTTMNSAIKTGEDMANKVTKIEEQAREIARLSLLITCKDDAISSLTIENDNLMAKNVTLGQEKSSIQTLLNGKSTQLDEVSAQKEIMEADNMSLRNQRFELESRLSVLVEDKSSLQIRISNLAEEVSSLELQNTTHLESIEKLKSFDKTFRDSIEEERKEVLELAKGLQRTDEALSAKVAVQKELDQTRLRVNELEKSTYDTALQASMQAYDQSLQHNQSALMKFGETIGGFIQSVQPTCQECAAIEQRRASLENDLRCTRKTLLKAEGTISKLENRIERPCQDCQNHEKMRSSLQNELVEAKADLKATMGFMGDLKKSIVDQSHTGKLHIALTRDRELFEESKEAFQRQKQSYGTHFDKLSTQIDFWRKKHNDILPEQAKIRRQLREEHEKALGIYKSLVESLKDEARSSKDQKHGDYEELIKSHKKEMEEKEDDILFLRAELELSNKNRPLPISPTSGNECSPTDGPLPKKRNHEAFMGSPQSKLVVAWRKYATEMNSVMDVMVPESMSGSIPAAFCLISQSFLTEQYLKSFREFENTKLDKWYCLTYMLSLGVRRCPKINESTTSCELCIEGQDTCVQVKNSDSGIKFRVIKTSTMQKS